MFFEEYDEKLKAKIEREYSKLLWNYDIDQLTEDYILDMYKYLDLDSDLIEIYSSNIHVNKKEKEKAYIGLLVLSLGLYLYQLRDEVLEDSYDYSGYSKDYSPEIIKEYLDREYKQYGEELIYNDKIWHKLNLLKIELDLNLEKDDQINEDLLVYSSSDIFRLFRTESAVVYTDSVFDKLVEDDQFEYVILMTEPGACKTCTSLAGIPMSVKDIKYKPPIHPNCRCTLVGFNK